MKARTMLAAGLFLASLPAVGRSQDPAKTQSGLYFGSTAAYTTAYLERAARNYELALKSTNDGTVESAIAFSAYMCINAPELNLSEIKATIAALAESGRTPVIRYKAYLASIVFENPKAFVDAANSEYSDSDQFFTVIASKVHRTLLGHNFSGSPAR